MPRDCQSANAGQQDILGYRAHSVRAGPVRFVWARNARQWGQAGHWGTAC